jgi:hypothetical protein
MVHSATGFSPYRFGRRIQIHRAHHVKLSRLPAQAF